MKKRATPNVINLGKRTANGRRFFFYSNCSENVNIINAHINSLNDIIVVRGYA